LHEVDPSAVRPAFERVLRAGSTIVAVLCAVGLAPLAALVPLLYGTEFTAVAPLLVALGVSGGFTVVASPISAFVLARLSGGRLLTCNAVALVVNLGLALALIPPLGVWGAALANVAGVVTSLSLLLWSEMRILEMRAVQLIGLAFPAGLGALSTGVAWVSTMPLDGYPFLRSFAALAVGLVSLLVGIRLSSTGLSGADRGAILRVVPDRARWTVGLALLLVTQR
jgi:O-antigen/teichoic acid export membrane protein